MERDHDQVDDFLIAVGILVFRRLFDGDDIELMKTYLPFWPIVWISISHVW